jgi:glutamyl-tRNA reductase
VGRSRVSVASVAVEFAREVIGDLAERRVLVIGAGDTAEMTARALGAAGVATVFVANRHYDRAIGLAQRFGGEAVRFDDLPAELARADIVVSATGSPHQIVGREELALVVAERGARPLMLVDIAVPRDIDSAVRDLAGIALYDMDDLQREVARNRSGREAEATRARAVVDSEVARFADWLASLEVVPTIAALRGRGDEVVAQVLAENAGRWESLSDADRDRVEVLARAVVRRLLHEPTLRLKRAEEGAHAQVQALRELFGLEPAADVLEPAAEVTDIASRRRSGRGSPPPR